MKKLLFLGSLVFQLNVLAQVPINKWTAQIGGSSSDIGQSVAIDTAGNVYATGSFEGTVDFDPSPNTFNMTSAGKNDIFITKFDNSGHFIWARRIGGTDVISSKSISINNNGDIYITGFFKGTIDFDPDSSTFNLVNNTSMDIFLLKLTSSGSFIWVAHFASQTGYNTGMGVVFDKFDNVYSTGVFQGTIDFDPGPGTYNLSVPITRWGNYTIKLSSKGKLIWAKCTYGPRYFVGIETSAIAIDKFNNIYTTGRFSGDNDFDPGPDSFKMASNGIDAFITKLDSSGNFIWAKNFGSSKLAESYDISIDAECNIYATGKFYGDADFDPGAGTYYLNSVPNNKEDAFILKLDSLGNFLWARSVSGPRLDIGYSIANDLSGNVYVCGLFERTVDLNPGYKKNILKAVRGSDVFILKLKPDATFEWATQLGGELDDGAYKILTVKDSFIYTIGYFYSDSFDFAPGFRKLYLNSEGKTDVFISKLKQIKCIQSYDTLNVMACNSYISPSGKYTWLNSAIYNDTILNVYNCDSIITIKLIINKNTLSNLVINSCGPILSPSKHYTWVKSGIYKDTIKTVGGCDSILNINLTIHSATAKSINVTACDSFISPSKKFIWRNSATYLDTLINSNGCDSIITFKLTIKKGSKSKIMASECYGFISPSKRHYWDSSGTYYDTILNKSGCDSLITIELNILKNSSSSITINSCDKYTSPSKKYVWTSSGIFVDSIPNKVGCDSIITINLSIPKIDTSINIQMPILTANLKGADYQWLNCNLAYSKIVGETQASFKPTKNGSYAVEIKDQGCTDTSVCYTISSLSIQKIEGENRINFYPNPSEGMIEYDIDKMLLPVNLIVLNSVGEQIMEKKIMKAYGTFTLPEQMGFYIIEVISSNGQRNGFKVLKIK